MVYEHVMTICLYGGGVWDGIRACHDHVYMEVVFGMVYEHVMTICLYGGGVWDGIRACHDHSSSRPTTCTEEIL